MHSIDTDTFEDLTIPTPIEAVRLQAFEQAGVELYVKRDDLIHPRIIGNKLRKSLPHFELCKQLGHNSVLTFGGRFSNHLLAIAQAGQQLNMATTGVVRGADLSGSSAVLDECRRVGMRIIPVESAAYYPLQQISGDDLAARLELDTLPYIIPEGGTSALALEGVGQIIDEIADIQVYNYIVCAAGTGGTAAGLAWALAQRTEQSLPKILAIAVLKGYTALPLQGQNALREKVGAATYELILTGQHLEFDGSAPWGRYGRPSEAVMRQLRELQDQLGFPIDYVYTGKVLLQIQQMARAGHFTRGSKLLFLHTGGYQTALI